MIYTIKYKYRNTDKSKDVDAPNEEEARKLLEQELIDIFNDNCIKNNIKPTKTNFFKTYKI